MSLWDELIGAAGSAIGGSAISGLLGDVTGDFLPEWALDTIGGATAGGALSAITGKNPLRGAIGGGALSLALPILQNAVSGFAPETFESLGIRGNRNTAFGQDFGNFSPRNAGVQSIAATPIGDVDFSGLDDIGSFETPGDYGPEIRISNRDSMPGPSKGFDTPYLDSVMTGVEDRGKPTWLQRNKGPLVLAALMLAGQAATKPKSQPAAAMPRGNFNQPLDQYQLDRSPISFTNMAKGDWYTFGQRPRNLEPGNGMFFTKPNSLAKVSRLAAGGDVPMRGALSQRIAAGPAIAGPGAVGHMDRTGNGRSDRIPAMLSNNEYVVDAETVSLLGDGDPDAGSKQLDKLRVNVRKHKGKALAKGKISPNAKGAMSYLRS